MTRGIRSLFVIFVGIAVFGASATTGQSVSARTGRAAGGESIEAAEKKRPRRGARRSRRDTSRPRGLRAREYYVYEHLIRRGDTVGEIARRYKVAQEKILSWNDLTSPHLIREGRTLTIYSKTRVPQRERSHYRVERGDTLGKIAQRHRMSVRELRSVNRIRGDLIRVGQRLVVFAEKEPEIARLGGRGRRPAGRGYLTGAVQLRSGRGFHVKNPRESWGTVSTIRQIRQAFGELRRQYGRSQACVGDISHPEGGPLDGHRSHQRGLDVDISFYRKGVARDRRFHRVTKKTIDVRRTWRLLHQFIRQGQVDMIFIDYALQEVLYEEARRRGARSRDLDEWFQYPRGRGAGRGVIRHEPGHANHMHVRFLDMTRSAARGRRAGAAL